jgi:large subunit ribosomal protein L22
MASYSSTVGLCRRLADFSLRSLSTFPQAPRTTTVLRSVLRGSNKFTVVTNSFRSSITSTAPRCGRIQCFSTKTESAELGIQAPTLTQPSLVNSADGRKFAAFEIPQFHRKLKPYIVKRRLGRMRTYEGAEKNIRHSPWRLNLVCQLAAGMTLPDALQQLEFCKKSMAPLVQKVLKRTANLADIRDGLQHSQLEVAECFATKGSPMKRMKTMGRGRTGRMEHKHAHFRVVLREIDFKLRMYQAPSLNQKKKWFLRQQQAETDAARVRVERAEMERMERETEASRTN